MKTRKVVSREYKVMLRAARFAGTEKQLLDAARRLWDDIVEAIGPSVFHAGGVLGTINKQRLVAFLDTDAQHLRSSGYVFRVRRSLDGSRPEVTLKFRHPDRYVAEARQMKSRRIRAVVKFEDDIKTPFVSLYGFSTRGRVGKKDVPSTLDGVSALFPDLARRLGDVDGQLALNAVNDFTARELVITGPILTIGAKSRVAVECALIVWYDDNGPPDAPVAVEFSYRYGNPGGRYSGKIAKRAFDIFATLQTELIEWVNPDSRTKTALVFDKRVVRAG